MKKVSRSTMLVCLLLVAALALAACGGGGGTTNTSNAKPAAAKGDATKGKTTFEGTCASCHGPDAKGLPGLGKDLTTSEWVSTQTDAQLLKFVKTGRPAADKLNTTGIDMPPKGGNPALTDADIENVIAYVRSIHQP